MNYQELAVVAGALDKEPTHFGIDRKREELLLQVDSLLGEANSERTAELCRFYRKRVDRVLAEVKAYNGSTPRLWKLYSSGVLIKDKGKVIAVDVNFGCVPGEGRTRLLLSARQVRILAEIIDEYYCTHSHVDHLSPEICDALFRRNKLMVMPQEAIVRWCINGACAAENLTSKHCRVFMNWQGNVNGGLDCAMYLFTLSNGKTVFVRGDIYHAEGFDGCLEMVDKWQQTIDYALMSPYHTGGGEAPVRILEERYKCRTMPIHEWEFSHRKIGVAGAATQCFEELYREFAVPYTNGRAQMLFWGEAIMLD